MMFVNRIAKWKTRTYWKRKKKNTRVTGTNNINVFFNTGPLLKNIKNVTIPKTYTVLHIQEKHPFHSKTFF